MCELTSSSYSLEKVLYILQDGLIILDKDGKITYINKAAQEIMKAQTGREPMVCDMFLDHARKGRKEITRTHIASAFRNIPTVLNLYYPQKGKDFWIELGYYPLPDPDGNIRNICIRAKNITDKVLLEQKLETEKMQMKMAVNRATIAAQDQERGELGQEMHDNINQVLTTVKLYNEIALQDEKTNGPLLLKSIQQLTYCIETIRCISRKLSMPLFDHINLRELIDDLINSISATKKVKASFFCSELPEKFMDKQLKVTIYRIVQEQMTNIIKYADAASAEIHLRANFKQITLKIIDNGKGFDIHKVRTGIGIAGMINRAEAIGGTLMVKSNIGKGCMLIAQFPLNLE